MWSRRERAANITYQKVALPIIIYTYKLPFHLFSFQEVEYFFFPSNASGKANTAVLNPKEISVARERTEVLFC